MPTNKYGKSAVLVALTVLIMVLSSQIPSAQLTLSPGAQPVPQYCQSITSTSILANSSTPLSNLISISLIIMLLMFVVCGVLYALGSAFRFDRLVRFSKQEIGEILLSGLIIIVFISIILAANSAVGLQKSGGAIFNAQPLFQNDCGYLSQTVSLMWSNFGVIFIDQVIIASLSNILIKVSPPRVGLSIFSGAFSVSFQPLHGLALISGDVKSLSGLFGGMGILSLLGLFTLSTAFGLIGVSFFLGLIYSLFPLFLYVGIVLRTMPWTRAAGGAFLGVFISFYLFMPLILLFLLRLNPPPADLSMTMVCIPATPGSVTCLSFQGSNAWSIFVGMFKQLGNIIEIFWCGAIAGASSQCFFTTLISDNMAPAFYSIFALMISFLLAFDFAGAVSRLLGAPSLNTRHMVRHLL